MAGRYLAVALVLGSTALLASPARAAWADDGAAGAGAVGGGTAGIGVTVRNDTQPYSGELSIRVAVDTAVELVQADPTTAAGHPEQGTDPSGHRRAWVFTGGLAGIAVRDTRPSQAGWTVAGQATDLANGATTVPARNLGWIPVLLAGSDAEGTPYPGAVVSPYVQSAAGNGLAAPGSQLGGAPAGSGLGTQNLGASLVLWISDTSPTGAYLSTLTLTLISL